MKTIVGLTGPTGSGKSIAAEQFAARGFCVLDADCIARQVVEPGSAVLDALAAEFGGDILSGDGSLNRKLLASRAFASKDATARLNALTHPAILRRIEARIAAADSDRVLLDAPQLFESGCDHQCTVTVAVLADADIRRRRIMERDGLTQEQADRRMSVQFADNFYREHCDYILDNNGNSDALRYCTDRLIDRILGDNE